MRVRAETYAAPYAGLAYVYDMLGYFLTLPPTQSREDYAGPKQFAEA